MPKGFFVTFEGLDGSGKSTQLHLLHRWLQARGETVTVTRQPGGTPIGERIRDLLLNSRTENLSPLTELGLMFSDRAQSIASIIQPALDRGDILLCDRFTDSTEAYQGGGRELGSRLILDLHKTLCGGLMPNLTFLLLPDFQQSLGRARRRNKRHANSAGDENRFEQEDDRFYRRVWDKYREIAAREPERVIAIESNGTIEEIHRDILDVLENRLAIHRALSAARSGGS